jgi:hypothetical protein
MRAAILLHPQYVFMAWCLVKDRDNFNFTFDTVLHMTDTVTLNNSAVHPKHKKLCGAKDRSERVTDVI